MIPTYHVNVWTPHYAAVRGIGTITLPALPVDATGRATAADIVALFAGEGLRATVAPVNLDGTVPSRATITVYGPTARKDAAR